MSEIPADRSLQELLDAVAARTTAPGGGVVAGVVAALAGALGGMCARFTDGDQNGLVLQADGERTGLPCSQGRRFLGVDAGALDDQVVWERTLVLDREGVVPWGEGRLVEGDRELVLDHADTRAHGRDRGGGRGAGGRRGVGGAVRARAAAGAKQKNP